MLTRLFSIAKNTFTETLRQPIYAIIIVFALLLMLLAPAVSMYTLDEDVKMLRELGLSTLFLAGLFIAVFSSTGAITEEIESGTITTVLSKPISRPVFILGKFIGILGAVTLAHTLITFALLMVTRHGADISSHEFDWTVISAAIVVVLLAFILTAFFNYVYGWSFPATGVIMATILSGFAVLFLFFVDKEWKFNPADNHFDPFDITASALLLMAVYLIVALAILLSSRLNEILTLTGCIAFFLVGLISDWMFGRVAILEISNKINIVSYVIIAGINILLLYLAIRLYFRFIYRHLPKFFFGNMLGKIIQCGIVLFFISLFTTPFNILVAFIASNFMTVEHLLLYSRDIYIFLAKVASTLTPNFQVFWVSDAIYETGVVPVSYLWQAGSYTLLYTAGILALAVALFQRRQVG